METVMIDTREKARAIRLITAEFDRRRIPYVSTKLFVGDYQLISNGLSVVDRKQSLLELTMNVTEKRFEAELKRAKAAGVTVTFLCEHGGGIKSVEDVLKWENPRLKESPMAVSGERLYRKMMAYSHTYGVKWAFCEKKDTGRRILEILGVINGHG